ncbi:MAG: hypothetical protein AVDCRST_MAG32-2978, partial [uncultured Nocardioides sp.]
GQRGASPGRRPSHQSSPGRTCSTGGRASSGDESGGYWL